MNEGLPTTAYLKMIDVWLIFNLIVPFVEVLLHTYKVRYGLSYDLSSWVCFKDNLREEDKREVNHHGRVRTLGNEKVNWFDSKFYLTLFYWFRKKMEWSMLLKAMELEVGLVASEEKHQWHPEKFREDLVSRHEDVQVSSL